MTRHCMLFCLALVMLAAPARAVDVKPKLTAGSEAYYRADSRTDLTQKMVGTEEGQPAREMSMKRTTELGIKLKCTKAKDDGGAVLEWSLAYLTLSMEGMQNMSFDSRDPAQNNSPIGGMLSVMLNAPATIVVDAAGKVLEYTDPPTIGGGPVRQFMEQHFSKDAFERLGFFLTGEAPNGATPGAAWATTRDVELSGPLGTMVVTTDYKLSETRDKDQTAVIAIKGGLAMKPVEAPEGADAASQPGLTIEKGEFGGEALWDCSAGQLISDRSDMTLVGVAASSFGKFNIEQQRSITLQRLTPEEFKHAAETPAPKPPAPKAEPAPDAPAEPAADTPAKPAPSGGDKKAEKGEK